MSQAAIPGTALADPSRPRLSVVSAIGVGQILAWGSSYYLTAILAKPIADDTGWPLPWIVGALSVGLLVSGLISPRVGRLIARRGGRPVLAASAVLLAAGLLCLGLAPNVPVFVLGWAIVGAGMGAGLYDPAFSTLGRLYGENARSAITQVTLFGGFASTVCWPLSAYLLEHVGWRGTCLAYAAIHVAVVLPLYLLGVPREPDTSVEAAGVVAPPPAPVRSDHRVLFWLLAAGLTLASVTMAVVSVHLLTLLQSQGVALATAVAFGALLGPSQVGARVLEAAFGRKHHPVWSMVVSTVLVAIGLGMMVGAPGVAAVGIVLYGSGSGIRSIARGTVPLALFGKQGYAELMGRLAMPTLVAQAGAPMLGAWLLDGYGSDVTLLVLCGGSVLNVVLAVALVPFSRESRLIGSSESAGSGGK